MMTNCNTLLAIECEGDVATIHPFGATVISWKVCDKEKLFLSKKSALDGSQAIRGGVPVIFPQFANGKYMKTKHGFARNQHWRIEKVSTSSALCTLTSNDVTLSQWPYKFELKYIVSIKKGSLHFDFTVINREDTGDIEFTSLLHTYFRVQNIDNVRIYGFKGLSYINKARQEALNEEIRGEIVINEECDNIYINCPSTVYFDEGGEKDKVIIEKCGFEDMVVWNPWIEKAAQLSDFDDLEYREMVCLEAGQVFSPVHLPAGQSWKASMTLFGN